MKKFLKWFLGLAAVGTVLGLIIAYFCKDSETDSDCDCTDDMEDEDFDLDSDLKPVSERGYVHLNKSTSESSAESVSQPEDTTAEAVDDAASEESED